MQQVALNIAKRNNSHWRECRRTQSCASVEITTSAIATQLGQEGAADPKVDTDRQEISSGTSTTQMVKVLVNNNALTILLRSDILGICVDQTYVEHGSPQGDLQNIVTTQNKRNFCLNACKNEGHPWAALHWDKDSDPGKCLCGDDKERPSGGKSCYAKCGMGRTEVCLISTKLEEGEPYLSLFC